MQSAVAFICHANIGCSHDATLVYSLCHWNLDTIFMSLSLNIIVALNRIIIQSNLQYNKPLYKGRFSRSQIIGLPIWFLYILNLREDNLSTKFKDKRLEFILFPKCPLLGGLTVFIGQRDVSDKSKAGGGLSLGMRLNYTTEAIQLT